MEFRRRPRHHHRLRYTSAASQHAAAPFGNFDGSNLQVVLLRLRLCRARLLHYYGILQLLTTYNEREL